MRRLLASDLLPKRAGQPVKGLVHIYFAELREMDGDGALQDKWIAVYRARWAGQRAGAAVSTGDGGAWLEGDAARAAAAEAILIPVVTGDIDVTAIEDLITACVEYERIRGQSSRDESDVQPGDTADEPSNTAGPPGSTAQVLAMLERQILAAVIQVVSGPGGGGLVLAPRHARQGPQRPLAALGRGPD